MPALAHQIEVQAPWSQEGHEKRNPAIPTYTRCPPAGLVLVRFYGEHSTMWVKESDCELPADVDEAELERQFRAWARAHNK